MRCWLRNGVGGPASVLAQRAQSEGEARGGWNDSRAPATRTIGMCSLDGRSRNHSHHPVQRMEGVRLNGKKAKGQSWVSFTFALYLLPLAFLAGCAGWPWRSEPPLREATAGQLTDLLREREAAIQTMKGLFRAQIKGPGISIAQRLEGAMFYRRPNALRLQGFDQLGGELFELVLGEDLYRLRIPSMGRVYAGRPAELERMGELGRPFQLSIWAMSGAVGTAPVSNGERVRLSEDGDRYRLDVLAPKENGSSEAARPVRRIWFERRSFQVVQEDRLTLAGDVEATIFFEDFRPVGASQPGGTLTADASGLAGPMLKPFKITTRDGQGRGTLQLTFHELVPNPTLRPEELGSVRANSEHSAFITIGKLG